MRCKLELDQFICNFNKRVGTQSISLGKLERYKLRDRWIPVALPPPRPKYLTLLTFLSSPTCELAPQFGAFARALLRSISRRDDFIADCRRLQRACLACAFWWCGSLSLCTRIRGGRVRRATRDSGVVRFWRTTLVNKLIQIRDVAAARSN